MIEKFVGRFMEKKDELRKIFGAAHPSDYEEIVKDVVSIITDEEYGHPDRDKIHKIDDGDYQGTLLFIIPEKTYQPNTYWAVNVDYCSCSGCDTLEAIRDFPSDKPTESQVEDYMTLALHIVQNMKEI